MDRESPVSSLPATTTRAKRLALLLPAMCVPLLASWVYFVLVPGTVLGNAVYTGVKGFALLWPLLAVGWILRERFRDPSPGKRHLASLAAGIAFGLAVVGLLVFLLKATPLHALVAENAGRIAERTHDLGVAEHYLLFALFISFIHSALEEYYWRWFVFGQLRWLLPAGAAVAVASVAFAAHHVVVLGQFFAMPWAFALGFCVALGGAVWCWLWLRYGSLLGSWASHVVVDLGLMWVGWEVLQGRL